MNKVVILFVICIAFAISNLCAAEDLPTVNILNDIPYQDKDMGRRILVNTDELLMMQAALKPGQSVPHHTSDSNVRILVIEGDIIVTVAKLVHNISKGDLLKVEYDKEMDIENTSSENASFIVIKTPHPKTMK